VVFACRVSFALFTRASHGILHFDLQRDDHGPPRGILRSHRRLNAREHAPYSAEDKLTPWPFGPTAARLTPNEPLKAVLHEPVVDGDRHALAIQHCNHHRRLPPPIGP
jgi:hypothetical protein